MSGPEAITGADSVVTLSAVELERLLITIESSQQVHRRYQFFLWSQGALQSFLPHDMLLIAHGEYGTPAFRSEILARTTLLEDRGLTRELDLLIPQIAQAWRGGGCRPCLYGPGVDGPAGSEAITATLDQLGLGPALAHGAREFLGESAGFFVFLRMPVVPGRRQAYFAEVLMPHLFTTLHRMLQSEKIVPGRRPYAGVRLSEREIEVMALIRDGKTNQQIAQSLTLSPLTVKNHVQNILRKLDVANRAQAVAKVVQARLIGDGADS